MLGVFPGSFNPPTVAHLAIAAAAVSACPLDRVDLCVSRVALGKESVEHPRFEDRIAVLELLRMSRPWLGLRITESRLLVDIAQGYDWLILGADKWAQIMDRVWYGGSDERRDEAVRRLPRIAVAARAPFAVPENGLLLDIDPSQIEGVSSTAARGGATWWMVEEAARFAQRTGAWIDVARYERERVSDR